MSALLDGRLLAGRRELMASLLESWVLLCAFFSFFLLFLLQVFLVRPCSKGTLTAIRGAIAERVL